MDEAHFLTALRYVEQNPVRAGLVEEPGDWTWSSVRAHLRRRTDKLTDRRLATGLVDDWAAFLAVSEPPERLEALRSAVRTGRPAGDVAFVAGLEERLGVRLRRRQPGRKPGTEDVSGDAAP